MIFALLLFVGGVIGWIGSLIFRDKSYRAICFTIIIGITGSLLTGLIVTPLLGETPLISDNVSALSILASSLGSILILSLINLIQRNILR
ncbi:MAG: hypothetical protein ACRCY3_00380 [Sphingorhabdus sp.]